MRLDLEEKKPQKGRILFLNGVTSSGKTSIVEALQARRDVFFYVVANDLFQEMVGEDYLREDYWKYLERGTRLQGPYRKQGKRPPLKPFVDWVRYKAIPLRGKKPEQVAWAVATKVWKEGTKPFWFLRDSLAEIPDIDKRVEEALRADIETYIQEMIAEL